MGSLVPALELISRVFYLPYTFIILVDPFIASISIFTFSLSYGIIYFVIRQYLLEKQLREKLIKIVLISKEA